MCFINDLPRLRWFVSAARLLRLILSPSHPHAVSLSYASPAPRVSSRNTLANKMTLALPVPPCGKVTKKEKWYTS